MGGGLPDVSFPLLRTEATVEFGPEGGCILDDTFPGLADLGEAVKVFEDVRPDPIGGFCRVVKDDGQYFSRDLIDASQVGTSATQCG